ncbi:MAG: cytochrome c biogenesis CcdA family protein [Candidatus Kariarchaeaceae archaeon]
MIDGIDLSLNFALGLLATFSPCLFPLFPTYVAIVTKSGYSKSRSLFSSFSLIAGVLLVFLSLTFLTNQAFRSFLIDNYVSFATLQAIFLMVAGILMLRPPLFLSKIQIPAWFYKMISNEEKEPNPYLVSFILGLLYTIIAAPCAGGYFFAFWNNLLGLAFVEQFILVLMFSLGAGTPFLIASVIMPEFGQDLTMRFQDASHKISQILGIMLIIVGFWLLSTVS